MASVTIAVPVCGTAPELLARCLKSAACQSLPDIEIIIVNDAADDAVSAKTKKVIDEYKAGSVPVEYISLGVNRGLIEARRAAVEAARGSYVFFLDSDDELAGPDVCRVLYETGEKYGADIVQGRAVPAGNTDSVSAARLAVLRETLSATTIGVLRGNIAAVQFEDEAFPYFVWGKLFSAALCRRVFTQIPDTYCIMLEDLLISFLAANYACTYAGVADTVYRYYLGEGMTSSRKIIPLIKWEKYCSAASAFTILFSWMQNHPQSDTITRKIQAHALTAIRDQLIQLDNVIAPPDREAAAAMLDEYWGAEIVQKVREMMHSAR